MSNLFVLQSNRKVGVFDKSKVWGQLNSSGEQVLLFPGAQQVQIEKSIDRVDFSGASSDFTFRNFLGTLFIADSAGNSVCEIQLNVDTGIQLAFTDGLVQASISSTGQVTLGGQTIENFASAVPYNGSGLNPSIKTEVPGVGTPSDTPGSTDSTEPNDTRDTATVLEGQQGSLSNLAISSETDVDVYKITLDGEGTADNFIRANFSHASGNLDMYFYNSLGTQLGSATTFNDNESFSLSGLEAGEYYVAVQGRNGATNSYSLEWNTVPRFTPDAKESNDSRDKATVLTEQTGFIDNLSIHSRYDSDYFKITMDGEGTADNFVRINFANVTGNLDMYLYNVDGTNIKTASSMSDNEEISFSGLQAGDYYIEIVGRYESELNNYSLEWNTVPRFTPDSYEQNDSRDKATVLIPGSHGTLENLSIHSRYDTDYYKITLTSTGTSDDFVRANFLNVSGNLDMHLYNTNGDEVKHSTTLTDNEEISLADLPAGEYYVQIVGRYEGELNNYSLEWHTGSIISSGSGSETDNFAPSILNMPTKITSTPEFIKNAMTGFTELTLPDIQVKDSSGDTLSLTYAVDTGNFYIKGSPSVEYYMLNDDKMVQATGSVNEINEFIGHIGYEPSSATLSRIKSVDGATTLFTVDISDGTHLTTKTYELVGEKSSEFSLSNGDTAFVMGITGLAASSFQNQVYTNPAVIDAEKNSSSADDSMCWAATASNMLTWTWWGEVGLGASAAAALANGEDTVFEYFKNNFITGDNGGGGHQWYGAEWFFDGSYYPADAGWTGWDMPKDGTGNKTGFALNPYMELIQSGGTDALSSIADALRDGHAVGLSFDSYASLGDEARTGGHAITCWGYTYDSSKAKGSTDYYTGLIVTDSDNSEGSYSNGRDAEDSLKIMDINWSDALGAYYITPGDYPTRDYSVLNDVLILSADRLNATNSNADLDAVDICGVAPDLPIEDILA